MIDAPFNMSDHKYTAKFEGLTLKNTSKTTDLFLHYSLMNNFYCVICEEHVYLNDDKTIYKYSATPITGHGLLSKTQYPDIKNPDIKCPVIESCGRIPDVKMF